MKKLLLILSVLISLASNAAITASVQPTKIYTYGASVQKDTTIVLTIGKPQVVVVVNSVVIDDGYYNAFPFPLQLSNGTIISFYKKSSDHAGAGAMTLAKSTDGGLNWTETQVKVDGVGINCAALSVGILSSGRILIGYQDNTLYTSLKFAYNDVADENFTSSVSVLSNGTGLSFSPVKMRILPSGKILCGYYTGYGTGENAVIGFVTSTDGGVTWSFGATIFSHAGTGFGDDKGYEFGFEIIDNTGSDATCKMIALVRDATQGAVYMHYYSSDGGVTWSTSFTVDNPGGYSRHYFYPFGSYTSAAPCDIVVHNGIVYVVTGYRNSGAGQQFALEYTTASLTDAFTNNFYNWSSVSVVLYAGQNDVNFGYSLCFPDQENKLWCQYYNVSPLSNNGLGTPRVRILQQLIAN